ADIHFNASEREKTMASWKVLTEIRSGERLHVNLDAVAEMRRVHDHTDLWVSREHKIVVKEDPDQILSAPDAEG
ncbi:MAG: hypothetical protein WA728_05185, partial [Xanthobacteraceae bacterium]